MKQRSMAIAAGVVLTLLVVAGCTAGAPGAPSTEHPAGFLLGFWHGIIAPIAFVISLFNSHVGIYEVNNNGHWYDLGFLLGVIGVCGGAGNRARKRNGK